MEDSKNLFSLFEHNGFTDRALESRVIVADVLAKFERYVIYSGHYSAFKGLFDHSFTVNSMFWSS